MPRRGQRPITREQILCAGVTLADAEGIRAVTMRRVGQSLGVEAMALYNHVAHKDDLLDGMLDRVASEIETPTTHSDWRHTARQGAISAYNVLIRHPWAAALWSSRITLGPQRMRYMDDTLRKLREAGFSSTLLDRAYHTIENHIVGHAVQKLSLPLTPTELREVGEQFLHALPTDTYPDLSAHVEYHLTYPHAEGEFEFGLDLILDGLAQLRSAS